MTNLWCCIFLLFTQLAAGQLNTIETEVTCDEEGFNVDAISELPFQGLVYTKGFFGSSDCRFGFQNNVAKMFAVSFPAAGCGTEFSTVSNNSFITNTLIFQQNPIVQTSDDIEQSIMCDVARGRLRNLKVPSGTAIKSKTHSESLKVWLDIKNKEAESKTPIYIGDELIVSIHIKGGIYEGALITNCVAHESPELEDSSLVLRLSDVDGCSLKPELLSHFSIKNNVEELIGVAHLKAFRFTEMSIVYLSCDVEICEDECQNPCFVPIPEYSSFVERSKILKKRSVDEIRQQQQNPENTREELMRITKKAIATALKNARKRAEAANSSKLQELARRNDQLADSYETEENALSENSWGKAPGDFCSTGVNCTNENDFQKNARTNLEITFANLKFTLTREFEVFSPEHVLHIKTDSVTSQDCFPRLRFIILTSVLSFTILCLLSAVIYLAVKIKKEKKKHLLDNFLLYRYR